MIEERGLTENLSWLIAKLPKAYDAPAQTLITIRVGNDFEPHGRASEDWEIIVTLTLYGVPRYWLSNTGWRLGNDFIPMQLNGRTLEDVIRQAIAFLEWYLQQNQGEA